MQVFRSVRSISTRLATPNRFHPSTSVSSFRVSPSSSSLSLSSSVPFPSLLSSFPRSFGSPPPSAAGRKSGRDEIYPGLDEVPGVDVVDNWHKSTSKIKWHTDFKTEVVSIQCVRNVDGDLEGVIDGETVIFPEQEPTIEWVLSTPVDLHLFDEVPVVKECPEHDEKNAELVAKHEKNAEPVAKH